jgi:hypothetical protein
MPPGRYRSTHDRRISTATLDAPRDSVALGRASVCGVSRAAEAVSPAATTETPTTARYPTIKHFIFASLFHLHC